MTIGGVSPLQPFAKFLVELPPRIRWHVSALKTKALRTAFAGLGPGTVIVAPRKLRGVDRISIGADCAVFDYCWLEAEPGATLTLGDKVYVGNGSHLHAVDDVTIGSNTMVADNVLINSGEHVVTEDMRVRGLGPISIGSGCFIGVGSVVLSGVTIGDGATVGAGAVVTRDVPAGATVAGVPARIIKGADLT